MGGLSRAWLLVFVFLGLAGEAQPNEHCRTVWAEVGSLLRPVLVADTPEVEERFLAKLRETEPRLAEALAERNAEKTQRLFKIEQYEAALAQELLGLDEGMAFSLLRHGYEGTSFALQEKDLIGLWARPDILYFAPGHGSPGARHSVAASPTILIESRDRVEEAGLRLELFMPGIWEMVANTPAAERAKAVFYATCNAGLGDVRNGEAFQSAASLFARRIQRPVVAPMGALTQLVTTKEPSVLVYTSVNRMTGSGVPTILHEDNAFSLFLPDGTSEPISFKDAMALVAQPGVANQYINDWNSPN